MLESARRAMELQKMVGITRQTAASAFKQYGNDVHRALVAMIEAGEVTLADLHIDACPPSIVAAAQARAARRPEAVGGNPVRATGLCGLSYSGDDIWEGQDVFAFWKDCYVSLSRGKPREDSRDETARQGQVLVSAQGTPGETAADGWTEPQRAAYLYLKQNEARVGEAVMAALLRFYQDEVMARREDWVSTRLGAAELEQRLPSVHTIAELRRMVALQTVFVWRRTRDGAAYMGLGFACAWDEEHDAGVVMHGDRVVAVGDASTAFDEESFDDGEPPA